MRVWRKLFIFLFFLMVVKNGFAQPEKVADSLKRELAKVTTAGDKVYLMDILARALMNVSPVSGDSCGAETIRVAEESRDRKLMIKAYMSNGLRCSYFAGTKKYITQSIEYYEKALQIARENSLDEELGAVNLMIGIVYLNVPDKDKALSYVTQGSSILSTLNNDSLKIETNYKFGDVYLARNEKILSLRSYLTGLRLAEEIKAKDKRENRKKAYLIRAGNINLAGFYSNIGDYDRAIDKYTLASEQLDKIEDKNVVYMRVSDVNSIGQLYGLKKNYDMAIAYYERCLKMADSLQYLSLKSLGYISMLNQYLRMNDPQRALTFMNSERGAGLKTFLGQFGFHGVVPQAYGVIYSEMGRYDSAKYYFDIAMPYFEKNVGDLSKMNFFLQLGKYHWRIQQPQQAIDYYMKVKELGEKGGQLEFTQAAVQMLDSVYAQKGDYKLASEYNGMYYKYKDSLDKLNKEKELVQVEAANEQLRIQRIEKEKEEARKKRFAIQYFGITIAIAAFIVALVMLGMFKVSTRTIRLIGFFTFLMLFEFLFLIFKKNVSAVTEGEPWKDLLFMIALAAILLPLHHWLEHKVIHYLTSHNRLTSAGKELKTRFFTRKKVGHDS